MNVLVISVHPDDEALGCAGTIFKHRSQGDAVHWLILTEAHEPKWSAETIQRKAEEVRTAAEFYGVQQCVKLGLPAAALDQIPQDRLIGSIAQVAADVRPEIVYTIHDGDVHSDHRAAFSAITSAIKPFNMGRLGVRRLLSFETLSSTDAAPPLVSRHFAPTVYTDITPHLQRKLQCMKIFASECQPELAPRGNSAIEALARFRGATINVQYAEAFMLLREVN